MLYFLKVSCSSFLSTNVEPNSSDDGLFISVRGIWSSLCSNPCVDSAMDYLLGERGLGSIFILNAKKVHIS